MMLEQLVKGVSVRQVLGDLGVEISAVTQDSRRVRSGALFVAIPGTVADGQRFVPDAIQRGASAIVTSQTPDPSVKIPQICVQDPRRALAELAARFYGDPSLKMRIVGITGTNGKTSITYLLEAILREAGRNPAVLGTVNYRFGGKSAVAPQTTPESVDLQKLFSEMLTEGVTDVVMEVSSHALAMGRVRNVHFDVCAFTNLTQDHLDYHQNLEEYFLAKTQLFTDYLPASSKKKKTAVVNLEDARGKIIARQAKEKTCRVSVQGPGEIFCRSLDLSEEGIVAEAALPGGKGLKFRSGLIGRHNLENLLVTIGIAQALGISADAIERGISNVKNVPGRLERIENDRGLQVFVDYAHTPDAVSRVTTCLKEFAVKKGGRLITVIGCGGDRDRTKRPMMGREAGRASDLVVVTSDNPRTEDPQAIIDEILPGLREIPFPEDRLLTIVDREAALKKAVEIARPGDFILVAGKGHEDYQILGKTKIHFSDQEILKRFLK